MPDPTPDFDVQLKQQEIINGLLDRVEGAPEEEIESRLTAAFAQAGLQPPPHPWLRTVAAEISVGSVYVVGNGTVPAEYFATRNASDPDETPV